MWSDLFTTRQLVALTAFFDLVQEVRERIQHDSLAAGLPDEGKSLGNGGSGAMAYAEAVKVYLAFAIDKSAVYWNSLCPWLNQPKNEIVGNSFGRQAIPIVWDFAEASPLSDSGGNIDKQVDYVAKVLAFVAGTDRSGVALQADAADQMLSAGKLVSTDPPYYDNVPYADLSDFFDVWLRRSLGPSTPICSRRSRCPKPRSLSPRPTATAVKKRPRPSSWTA